MSAWNTETMFPASDGVKANYREFPPRRYPDWVIVTKPGDTMAAYEGSEPPPKQELWQVVFVPKRRKRKRKKKRGPHCVYCNIRLTLANWTQDHFIPRSKGGGGGDNLVPACLGCNATKADNVFPSIEEAREYIRQKSI